MALTNDSCIALHHGNNQFVIRAVGEAKCVVSELHVISVLSHEFHYSARIGAKETVGGDFKGLEFAIGGLDVVVIFSRFRLSTGVELCAEILVK